MLKLYLKHIKQRFLKIMSAIFAMVGDINTHLALAIAPVNAIVLVIVVVQVEAEDDCIQFEFGFNSNP